MSAASETARTSVIGTGIQFALEPGAIGVRSYDDAVVCVGREGEILLEIPTEGRWAAAALERAGRARREGLELAHEAAVVVRWGDDEHVPVLHMIGVEAVAHCRRVEEELHRHVGLHRSTRKFQLPGTGLELHCDALHFLSFRLLLQKRLPKY